MSLPVVARIDGMRAAGRAHRSVLAVRLLDLAREGKINGIELERVFRDMT
jgi:hypothetical protein